MKYFYIPNIILVSSEGKGIFIHDAYWTMALKNIRWQIVFLTVRRIQS